MRQQDDSPRYTWRSAVMSKDSELPPTVRLVAVALSIHMSAEGGSCFPSIALVAAESGFCDRTVQKAIRHLEDAGWLLVKKGGSPRGGRRMANTYRATFPEGYLENEAGGARADGNHGPVSDVQGSPSGPVNVAPPTGERGSPQYVKRGRKETSAHLTKAERLEAHRDIEHWLQTLGVEYAIDRAVFLEEIAKLGVDPDYAEERRLELLERPEPGANAAITDEKGWALTQCGRWRDRRNSDGFQGVPPIQEIEAVSAVGAHRGSPEREQSDEG